MKDINEKVENNYNHNWINANQKHAYKFATDNDIYRLKKTHETYDPYKHKILKITAYYFHIEFAVLRSKDSGQHHTAHPLQYNMEPYEFKRQIIKVHETMKNIANK